MLSVVVLGFIIVYAVGWIPWLGWWASEFQSEFQVDDTAAQHAAWMITCTPIWPILAIWMLVKWIRCVLRVALGESTDE